MDVINPHTGRKIKVGSASFQRKVKSGELTHIINPKTGYPILVGGQTFAKLFGTSLKSPNEKPPPKGYTVNPDSGRLVKIGGKKFYQLVDNGTLTKYRSTPIPNDSKKCTTRRKYKPKDAPFCGLAGNNCENTFPVNTYQKYREALTYARHAPSKEGIQACARHIARKKGWKKD